MGLAQNEMKAKPALPERVRSMEGLGLGVTEQAFYEFGIGLKGRYAPLYVGDLRVVR